MACCHQRKSHNWTGVDPDLYCHMAPLGHNEWMELWHKMFICFSEKKKDDLFIIPNKIIGIMVYMNNVNYILKDMYYMYNSL